MSIIEIQQGPSIEDIESKIITNHLGNIDVCKEIPLLKLRLILDSIVSQIYFASSKRVDNSLQDYIAFVDENKGQLENVYINSKRISIETIQRLINDPITKNLFLSSRKGPPTEISSSKDLMFLKMQYGLIDDESIELMDDCRTSAEAYVFENYYKTKEPAETLKQLDQIRTIVKNQAIESKSRSKLSGLPYGINMLHSIEDRLEKIVEKRHKDVYYTPYEILKGLIGVLTNECQVSFSEEPPGGWKRYGENLVRENN